MLPIQLIPTTLQHLPTLHTIQCNYQAAYMAAFMPSNYLNKEDYINKYTLILQNPSVNNQSIFYNHQLVGSIAKFMMHDEAEITYWIDKAYWSLGIATEALRLFLLVENTRPLVARTAHDNLASQHVLIKQGFIKSGIDKGFAFMRNQVIEEYVFRLQF